LALFREKDSVIRRVFKAEEAEALRGEVAALLVSGSNIGQQEYPLSQTMKRALAWGTEAANNLNHAEIGPEHLLLGILKQPDAPVALILRKHGISEEILTREAMKQAVPRGTTGAVSGGWGAGGQMGHSRRTSSRMEDGVYVTETRQMFAGHEITLIERMQVKDGGKVLHYSQEIRGPKKDHRFEVDFDIG
jgi:ATP-dependent Clp protease ATP-binding subunit ClpA